MRSLRPASTAYGTRYRELLRKLALVPVLLPCAFHDVPRQDCNGIEAAAVGERSLRLVLDSIDKAREHNLTVTEAYRVNRLPREAVRMKHMLSSGIWVWHKLGR